MDVAWSPDGAALLSGCVMNDVLVFDVEARRSVVSSNAKPWTRVAGWMVGGAARGGDE